MTQDTPLPCAAVLARFSPLRDGDLGPAETLAVRAHLAVCGPCARRLDDWSRPLELLRELPSLDSPGVADHISERLAFERGGGSLGLLLRPAPRPFLRPAMSWAAIVVVLGWLGLWSLGPLPVQARHAAGPWPGTEANPVLPTPAVIGPQPREAFPVTAVLVGAGDVFIETVVARDGRVVDIRVLQASAPPSRELTAALRARRFDPGRYRGQPVAMTVLHLISRVEVLSTAG